MLMMKRKHMLTLTRHNINILLDRIESEKNPLRALATAKLATQGIAHLTTLALTPLSNPEDFIDMPMSALEELRELIGGCKIPDGDVLYNPEKEVCHFPELCGADECVLRAA